MVCSGGEGKFRQAVVGKKRDSLPRSFHVARACPAGTLLALSPGMVVTWLALLSFFLFCFCPLTSEGAEPFS